MSALNLEASSAFHYKHVFQKQFFALVISSQMPWQGTMSQKSMTETHLQLKNQQNQEVLIETLFVILCDGDFSECGSVYL